MHTGYVLPTAELVTHELEIKRSRFITWVNRAASEDAARDLIHQAREAYPDARHHCSAFIVHVDGAQPIERSSDDGEPSGTAGKPMLEVLKGSGMLDICAVVIRYFGGVKLGTGGLVSAYTDAVSEAVAKVDRRERTLKHLATVGLPHADAGRIEAELRHQGIEVVGVEYGSLATYTLAFDPGERERIDATLAAATQGTATVKAAGQQWVELGV
ncbi:YigZ family protein [Corynebacterium sp. CNCTC7651]|uniref:IMPACT family protein n=1 Tax=Corynebacterium sp. CNCTC7651 TaxID=2815361 RepID=UPI001F1CC64C|nr:YigZ family protein [Corynebacterium sp. CNCTC7651]UIZ91552.1 YigZ family protein [Corynebacterium sp. CNCTC7651]